MQSHKFFVGFFLIFVSVLILEINSLEANERRLLEENDFDKASVLVKEKKGRDPKRKKHLDITILSKKVKKSWDYSRFNTSLDYIMSHPHGEIPFNPSYHKSIDSITTSTPPNMINQKGKDEQKHPKLNMCLDHGEAYAASYLITKEHLIRGI